MSSEATPVTFISKSSRKKIRAKSYEKGKIREKHGAFIREYLVSYNMTEAYISAVDPDLTRRDACKRARGLLNKKLVQEELVRQQRLARATEDEATMLARNEKRVFLARVVRTDLMSIDPDDPHEANGDLLSEVTRKYDKEGNHTSNTFKMPNKLNAIEMDNKMTGHNEPEVVEHRVNSGVMLLPSAGEGVGTIDVLSTWEKDAQMQQAGLKSGADPGQDDAVEAEFEIEDGDDMLS